MKVSPANDTIGSLFMMTRITIIVAMVFLSDNNDEGERELLGNQLELNDGSNGQDDNDDVGGINYDDDDDDDDNDDDAERG